MWVDDIFSLERESFMLRSTWQISAVQSDIKRTLEERETKMREMTVMHWTLIIIIIILENAFVLLSSNACP